MRATDHLPAGRVAVFIDYMNVYKGAREAFNLTNDAHWVGQVFPLRVGLKIAGVGDTRRQLVGVWVYRGQPSTSDSKSSRAFGRQIAAWRREPLVHPVTRPLNYRTNPPREKGIDVKLAVDFVAAAIRGEYDIGVIFSADTDLLPALEVVADIKSPNAVEVAAWKPSSGPMRRLRLAGDAPWCHEFEFVDFEHVRDDVDYTARGRRR